MSSFNRRLFLLTAGAAAGSAISGCGFTPAHGTNGAATRLKNSILLKEPGSRRSYLLVRHFEERMGSATDPRFDMSYSIRISGSAAAISPTRVVSRTNLLGTVTYSVRDKDTKKVLTQGTVQNFTSFTETGSTVAVSAARRAAEERLIVIMTDQIITELTANADKLTA